ncbi:MAG: hypothetical protein NTY03_04195 [Candidatus Bathyarchaeota archaeon]|nr:hypothetical protein [Candidatus Bathyarchaeota archaeon]
MSFGSFAFFRLLGVLGKILAAFGVIGLLVLLAWYSNFRSQSTFIGYEKVSYGRKMQFTPTVKKHGSLIKITMFVIGGWLGEFSFFASLIRAIIDWSRTGYLSAIPIIGYAVNSPPFNWWYGIGWRVGFYRGSLVDMSPLVIALVFLIGWILYEVLKSKI